VRFWLNGGSFWLRVKVGLGHGGVLAEWGWLLAQDEGWFEPGWDFGWMRVAFGSG
jgi:hypothetical protein